VNRRLYKSDADRVISGVAGGVAEYLDVDPSIVRVLWAVLALITGGVFLVLYIAMWIVVPFAADTPAAEGEPAAAGAESPAWNPKPARRAPRRSGSGSWVFGLILIGVGLYFLAREYFPEIDFDRLWPLGLVVLGVLLLIASLRRRAA
jgi:phage shock protein PspC (stress-responsive transcriptional regulator)